MGYIADEELPALYSGALGFLFPSLYEGFGLPPLEAMACGTPVITYENTAIPEVVGDCALFAEPLDPDSIAAAIQTLLDDRDLRSRLVRKGMERAKSFSWDISAKAVFNKLKEVEART
jgi:glycosyltransferase involved in cell wall biosynthesis